MKPRLEDFAVAVRCLDCGHSQVAVPARVDVTKSAVDVYFGSRYFHCDKCDGPVQDVPAPPDPGASGIMPDST